MNATYYYIAGVIFAALAACTCVAFFCSVCLILKGKKKSLYQQKLPTPNYPETFPEMVSQAYDATGDIKGMLMLLSSKVDKRTGKRAAAALDYLKHSRYRDYETALYDYLSDGSTECEERIRMVLEKEIRKQKGLICKN